MRQSINIIVYIKFDGNKYKYEMTPARMDKPIRNRTAFLSFFTNVDTTAKLLLLANS